MTEGDDDVFYPPDPSLPLPPEIDPESNHSPDVRDAVVENEHDQDKKHRNFVSTYNQDAMVNFYDSFSANVSTSNASFSRSNSELSYALDQELKPTESVRVEEQIAESMVEFVIDQALSLVSEKPSDGNEVDSSVTISGNTSESTNGNTPCNTTEVSQTAELVNEDLGQSVQKDKEAEQNSQLSEKKLSEGDNSHTCAAEDQVNSGGSIQSESMTKLEDTFSLSDNSIDQVKASEDLLSVNELNYTTLEPSLENGTASMKNKNDEDNVFIDTLLPAKVNINILNALYFPTKLVNGYVSISRDYDITGLTLSLICEGNQSISWSDPKSSKSSEEKINQYSEKIIETQSFFTDYVDLIHKESSDEEKLKFAFSYQFPPNLPSSFRYVQNDDQDLCAVIEYSFILLDIKENQMIAKKTVNMYEAPPYHYHTKSKTDSMKIFYLSCINRGTIKLRAELDKGCYFSGDLAQIRCCVENEASEKISEVGIYLCRYLHFKDKKFNQYKVRHVINRQKFHELEGKWSGKSQSTVLPFEVKEVTGTQSVSSSQFISCSHVIRVAIKTKSGFDLFVDLDVVLYNQNRNDITGNCNGLDFKRSLSFENKSNEDNSSSSSSSSDEPSHKDTRVDIETKGINRKKIVDSDQNDTISRKSSVDNVIKFLIDESTPTLQSGDGNGEHCKSLPNNCVSNEHESDKSSQTKQEDNLDVELPRFPEDYIPSSGDEAEDLSMQDVIVQL